MTVLKTEAITKIYGEGQRKVTCWFVNDVIQKFQKSSPFERKALI